MADINDINRINQARLVAENSLEQKNIERIQNTQNYKSMHLYEHWDECKELIFKLRTELIQYITEHGLVHGFLWQGHDQPIRNGKISITKKMMKDVTDTFGYLTDETGTTLIMQILTNGHYVSDEHYVHTDNNFTNDLKEKLDGIEPGAEVNKVVDVQFNGTSVVNDERVAIINLTNEDVKRMYEANPDTNCLTDALLGILESVEPFKEKVARDFEVVNNTITEKEQALLEKINRNKAEIDRVEAESKQRDTDNLNSLTEKINEVDENAKTRDNAIENSVVEAKAEATANYNVNKVRIDEANARIEQQNIKLQELDLLQIKEVTKEELDDRVIYKLKSKANQFIDTFIEIKKLPDDFNPVMNITIEKTGEKYKFTSVKRNGDEYAFETSDFNTLIEQATNTINTEIEGIKALLETLRTKTESIDTRLNEIQSNLQPIVDGWQEIKDKVRTQGDDLARIETQINTIISKVPKPAMVMPTAGASIFELSLQPVGEQATVLPKTKPVGSRKVSAWLYRIIDNFVQVNIAVGIKSENGTFDCSKWYLLGRFTKEMKLGGTNDDFSFNIAQNGYLRPLNATIVDQETLHRVSFNNGYYFGMGFKIAGDQQMTDWAGMQDFAEVPHNRQLQNPYEKAGHISIQCAEDVKSGLVYVKFGFQGAQPNPNSVPFVKDKVIFISDTRAVKNVPYPH